MEVRSRKPGRFGLALQDLLDQVVDDEAVVAGESGDEAGDVVTSLHRQRGQLERGDPAFGPALQRRDVRAEVQAHDLVEVSRGLVGVKRRSAARISTSWPRARSRARGSAGRRGCRSPGAMRRAGAPAGTPSPSARRGVDDVVVVEHEHDVVRESAARSLSTAVRRVAIGGWADCRSGSASLRRRAPRSAARRQGTSRRRGIVVPRSSDSHAEDHPSAVGACRRIARHPLGQQRGLAEPGRRGNEHQLRRGPAVQSLAQSRTRHQTASRPGGHRASYRVGGSSPPSPVASATCRGLLVPSSHSFLRHLATDETRLMSARRSVTGQERTPSRQVRAFRCGVAE